MVHAAKVAAVTVLRFLSRLSLWFLPNWAKLFFFWPEGWEFYYGCERPTACTVAPKEWNFGHIVSISVWPLRYHPWNDKHRKILRAYGAAPPPPDPFYEEIKARHDETLRVWTFEQTLSKLWTFKIFKCLRHGETRWTLCTSARQGSVKPSRKAAAAPRCGCMQRSSLCSTANMQLQSFLNILNWTIATHMQIACR